MKQRLGIAQALMNAPSLLLLDEPTSALDPIGRREVLDMVASLRGRTTVFFSTHILADVERVCDRVAILHRGRVVANATMTELKRRAAVDRLTLDVAGAVEPLLSDLQRQPWVRLVERSESRLSLVVADLSQAQREIPAAVARAGVGLRRLESGELSLEDVFVDLVTPNEQ
jgi:ABC-2 type transport system ATP-binding protein